MFLRTNRVNKLIKEQISQILLKEVEFDNAMVTITDVETSSNLIQSKVKITVFPREQEKNVFLVLEKNIYHLQQLLNKKLFMRPVPKIIFELDKGVIASQHLDEVLHKSKS